MSLKMSAKKRSYCTKLQLYSKTANFLAFFSLCSFKINDGITISTLRVLKNAFHSYMRLSHQQLAFPAHTLVLECFY